MGRTNIEIDDHNLEIVMRRYGVRTKTEAVALARSLSKDKHREVISSLAGLTSEPQVPPGQVRRGGFGGADGLSAYLEAEGIAETLDWAAALMGLGIGALDVEPERLHATLICLLKTESDLKAVTPEVLGRLLGRAA